MFQVHFSLENTVQLIVLPLTNGSPMASQFHTVNATMHYEIFGPEYHIELWTIHFYNLFND